jgi:hypothetical protein
MVAYDRFVRVLLAWRGLARIVVSDAFLSRFVNQDIARLLRLLSQGNALVACW